MDLPRELWDLVHSFCLPPGKVIMRGLGTIDWIDMRFESHQSAGWAFEPHAQPLSLVLQELSRKAMKHYRILSVFYLVRTCCKLTYFAGVQAKKHL